MRLVTAIVLIALFGALNANKAVFQELAQINKNPFGATMLAAISTNMRAKTPISDVQDLLNKILNDLQGDSATLDSNYHTNKDTLSAAIEGNQNLIATFEQTISNLEDAIQSYEAEGKARVQDYLDNKAAWESTQADLAATEADHDSQSADYAADIQNLNDAIAACNTALDRLNTYAQASGASLIQVASAAKAHLNNFASKMKEMSHKLSKHGSMYSPLIHELVQLTQNVDNGEVSQVVDLLKQLQNLLNDALSDLLAQQASYESNYQNHVQADNDNLAAYQANMDFDASRADEVGAQDVQANSQLAQAEQNLADAQASLENNQASYDANEANYADQRPRYDDLIAIVERLIDHFNNNVAAVDEWTANQINGSA
jgi:DNA repair exonuclease SbcCD ATPase subunit